MTLKASRKEILFTPNQAKSRNKLYRAIRALGPGTYSAVLNKVRNTASQKQNSYYWGYLVPEISLKTGKDRVEVDKILRGLFLKQTVVVADQTLEVIDSLSELTTSQISDFHAKIRLWAWDRLRLDLREPDKQT